MSRTSLLTKRWSIGYRWFLAILARDPQSNRRINFRILNEKRFTNSSTKNTILPFVRDPEKHTALRTKANTKAKIETTRSYQIGIKTESFAETDPDRRPSCPRFEADGRAAAERLVRIRRTYNRRSSKTKPQKKNVKTEFIKRTKSSANGRRVRVFRRVNVVSAQNIRL